MLSLDALTQLRDALERMYEDAEFLDNSVVDFLQHIAPVVPPMLSVPIMQVVEKAHEKQ